MAATDEKSESEISTKLVHLILSRGNVQGAGKSVSSNLVNAPLNALGISKNEKCTYKDTMKDRRRMRKQVGQTNRWRLPEPLGGDLLGTSQALRAVMTPLNATMQRIISGKQHFSQALRAVMTPLNATMQRIISAESPHSSVNVDPNKPYSFRQMTKQRRSAWSAPTSAETNRVRKLSKSEPSTQNLFYQYARKATAKSADIILKCLDISWKLHSEFVVKSPTLHRLLEHSSDVQWNHCNQNNSSSTSQKRSPTVSEVQLQNGQSHDSPTKQERAVSAWSDPCLGGELRQRRISSSVDESASWQCRSPASLTMSISMESYMENPTIIQLDVVDSHVTKKGFAIALGNLYYEELDISPLDIPPTLAAAHVLELDDLKERCAEAMCDTISADTVTYFHEISLQYNLEEISVFCERWLELNLIPILSKEIQLGNLSKSIIEKTISSKNLFTEDEFSVYQTVCFWLFLHLNPSCYTIPSMSAIVTYFNCLSKESSFLETEAGGEFISLFRSVRFQGITDTNHIHTMKLMNIIPQSWLIDVLCQHYSALQCGGDMCSIHDFELGSVRQGIVIEEGKSYDSQVMSLHGFHFNLRVNCSENVYTLYIQRLKPADPALSFRECERHTFSLRSERTVNYSITVQTYSHGKLSVHTTGITEGNFRYGKRTSRSKELNLKAETFPLYATFTILFPRS